jgi:phosphate transport system protein
MIDMYITRTQFEAQIELMRDQVLAMGSATDRMVGQAVQALTEQSLPLAEEVIAEDDKIDAMDLEIEEECIRLIALQAPVAHDLHVIGSALKTITDLERIGDHAVDIAKVARKLAKDTFHQPLVDIPRMAESVRRMLRDALTAFVNHDLEMVNVVVAADDEVDTLFHQLRDELHAVMRRDPNLVVQASYLLFVAHYLERIADHTVNIAERVYFAETGTLAQLAKSHKAIS